MFTVKRWEIEAGAIVQLFGPHFAVVNGGMVCIAAVALNAQRWLQLRNYNGD